MAHPDSSCISSQMKSKLDSNYIWFMLKFLKKLEDVIVILFLTSASFLCIATLKTSNFQFSSDQAQVFGLGVGFGALISNFNSKRGKTSSFDKKGIILLILVKYNR